MVNCPLLQAIRFPLFQSPEDEEEADRIGHSNPEGRCRQLSRPRETQKGRRVLPAGRAPLFRHCRSSSMRATSRGGASRRIETVSGENHADYKEGDAAQLSIARSPSIRLARVLPAGLPAVFLCQQLFQMRPPLLLCASIGFIVWTATLFHPVKLVLYGSRVA